MRNGMIFSGLLHAAIIALAVFGLPEMWQRIEITNQAIPVEIVDIGELTNAPPPDTPQELAEQAQRDDPAPQPRPAPPPPPEPEAPVVAAPVAPPKPKVEAKKPEPLDKPEPKPKPKLEEKPVQQAKAQAKPKRRPKPPKPSFDSVLKTVDKIRQKRRKDQPAEPERQVASTQSSRNIPDQPLTISELDAIRRQFTSCWNVDLGLKGIENMVVRVRVDLNPDRTIRSARILDRINPGNAHYRSFAESALRAVRNSRCSPVRLPPKKFSVMKTFTLRFSAKEMLGL